VTQHEAGRVSIARFYVHAEGVNAMDRPILSVRLCIWSLLHSSLSKTPDIE